MRVLYVWDADYPWDVRTEKVCLALSRHGHHVVIAARNMQGRARSEARPEGIVERLPLFPRWGRRLLSFPAFFNPFWLRHIRRLITRRSIDVVIVRDLPLAPAAALASAGRCPVILDMAENYPAMIADIWSDGRQRPLDALVRNPRIVKAVERITLRHLDHIITVVEESSNRLLALGIAPERLSVVSNTPPLSQIAPLAPRAVDQPLRIVYLGLMEHHRGIGSMLEAARLLSEARVSFHLDLVGDGRDLGLFRAQAAKLHLSAEKVTFHGRLSHAEAIAVIGQAHVGVVPHHATEAWNTTIPNKLFDYMAAGLAVVTSEATPAARVVEAMGSGLVFRSGDGRQLAEMLLRLLDIPAWDRYCKAGQKAILSTYNWEADTRTLLEVVSMVGARHDSRSAWLPASDSSSHLHSGRLRP